MCKIQETYNNAITAVQHLAWAQEEYKLANYGIWVIIEKPVLILFD